MKTPVHTCLIGFIGQGWIGKNYANDFEQRGHTVVRYGLEEPYAANKKKIASCDLVFIAVPTPTNRKGFDDSVIRSVLPLVGKGKVAVIKSTLLVGTTAQLQKDFPHCLVIHSPEFLSEKTAAHDAAHPDRNIVGIPARTQKYQQAAQLIMSVLPPAPFSLICSSAEAEMIKYSHNVHGYIQVVFANVLHDLAAHYKMDWDVLFSAFSANPLMVPRYLKPVHQSGRGAGGNCFIKDFEAFITLYKKMVPNKASIRVLEAIRDKNIALLIESGKDLDKVVAVYGTTYTSHARKSASKTRSKQ